MSEDDRHQEVALRAHDDESEPGAPEPRPGLASRTGDPIDTWLSLLAGMLKLRDAEKREIRDELEDHLRTRVRDQLVEGVDKATAVRRAIDEVGEASAVAHRFRAAARYPLRRTIMHVSILAVAATAIGIGAAALTTQPDVPASVFEETTPVQAAGLEDLELDVEPGWGFGRFAEAVGEAAGYPVYVHWGALADVGLDSDEWTLGVDIEDASLATVMRLLNDRPAHAFDRIDMRLVEGRLEFATEHYFDRLETTLVVYDLADVLEAVGGRAGLTIEQARSEVVDVIIEFVEPEGWLDNGGDLASLKPVGTSFFVKAPKRYHPKIRWILAELRDKEPGAGAGVVGQEAREEARVFVEGDVARPGVYMLPEPDITLRRMLATADARGAMEVKIVRDVDGEPTVVAHLTPAELADPVGPDPRVRPGDRIVVDRDEGGVSDAATIRVSPGDTLQSIAREHLGDAARWSDLAIANDLAPEDAGSLEVGARLRLPADTGERVGGLPATSTTTVHIDADDPAGAMKALAAEVRAHHADSLGMVWFTLDESGTGYRVHGPPSQVRRAVELARRQGAR